MAFLKMFYNIVLDNIFIIWRSIIYVFALLTTPPKLSILTVPTENYSIYTMALILQSIGGKCLKNEKITIFML